MTVSLQAFMTAPPFVWLATKPLVPAHEHGRLGLSCPWLARDGRGDLCPPRRTCRSLSPRAEVSCLSLPPTPENVELVP
jgi:hypothetical protein